MTFIPVLRFTVELSAAGGVFSLTTTQGVIDVEVALAAVAGVTSILNGRSPRYDPDLHIFQSDGGMGQANVDQILASS